LVQDRTHAGSDECVLTDLVASVATAFPDRDEIATAQRADAFFGTIQDLEHTPSVRSSIGNDYAISGDLLYKLPSGSTYNYNQALLCVPNSMVNSLFKHYHNSSLGGHFNGLRTYDRLRALYTWPKMGQDIFKRCESCHSCIFTRPRHPDTRVIMSSSPPTRPFERLSVDLIKFPRSKLGNEYAVVFIDFFTRWTEAMPVPDKRATNIISVMKEYILARHGIPNYLLSDEGSEVLNQLVAEVCKL
jgi:hypothetical protein